MKSWFDDVSDTELLDLIPLFEKLSKVDSVYTVLCNSNNPIKQTLYNNSQLHQSTATVGPIQSQLLSGNSPQQSLSSSTNSSSATSCNNLNSNELVNTT